MKERTISDRLAAGLRALRPACWYAKIAGSAMQTSGVPDFVVVFRGKTYFVEIKTETGVVSKIQEVQHARIREAGGIVVVLRGWPETQSWLDSLTCDSV